MKHIFLPRHLRLLASCTFLLLCFYTKAQNVGIGTTTPQAKLHVSEGSTIFTAPGYPSLSPGPAPVSGEGRRLMWYADKGAFRAGYTMDDEWDTDNTGFFSVAMGESTVASDDGTVALGMSSRASGYNSMATGYRTHALGPYSLAMGYDSQTWGEVSVGLGFDVRAMGDYSTALGYMTTADRDYATAFGSSTTASGEYATAMGTSTTASGNYSTALGYTTTASGNYSTAMGNTTTASGNYSTAMGMNVSTAGYFGSSIIGDYRTVTTNSTANNQMTMRFSGGYRLLTGVAGDGTTSGVTLAANGTSWGTVSDSTRKENFLPVNGEDFLRKIAGLRLGSWNYKGQDKTAHRHYGPMAQEFFAAFGHDSIGTIGTDTTITTADIDGVMMIAIKALIKENEELKEGNVSMARRLEKLEAILENSRPILSAQKPRN